MKGMVFTNFLDMVEEKFGIDFVDTIIEESAVPSSGAYTAVGTYPHTEMVALLQALEKAVSIPIPELLKVYGEHLFGKLAGGYPALLEGCHNSRELLNKLDGVIHVEVQKLYPDAELPRFKAIELPDGRLEMHYLSDRHMEDLAEGLLKGCLAHFKEDASIERDPMDDGTVRFTISYTA
ncbi:MAG: heme NO-binding domain-containing protein [Verrucomicrobiota bacterium]